MRPYLSHNVGRSPHADTPGVSRVWGRADPLFPVPPLLAGDVPEGDPPGGAHVPPHLRAGVVRVVHQLGAHSMSSVVDTLKVPVP